MTDMRAGRLNQCANGDHSARTLRVRVAHCPPPPVARKLSHPSWKVIVSASHGQYLKPGSNEPGFFSWRLVLPPLSAGTIGGAGPPCRRAPAGYTLLPFCAQPIPLFL